MNGAPGIATRTELLASLLHRSSGVPHGEDVKLGDLVYCCVSGVSIVPWPSSTRVDRRPPRW